MFRLFFTPGWFNGWDLVFDALTLIIALFIAGYSWRIFRISKENKYGFFAFAFILIALASLFKIGTTGLVYYTPVRDVAAAVLVPVVGGTTAQVNFSELLYRIGFFLHMVTMLGAWLLLFVISQKKSGRLQSYYEVSQIALSVYLIALISIFGNFKYFIFYLTSAVILGMTVLNYYKNYLNTNKNENAFLVMIAFIFMFLANLAFVFVFLWDDLYVLGEILLLLGFFLLMYTYRQVTRMH